MINIEDLDKLQKELEKVDPYAAYLGLRIIGAEGDKLIGEAAGRPELLNANGVAHGGFLCSMADVFGVLACTLSRPMPEEQIYGAAVSCNMNFLRPARDFPIRAEAVPIKAGKHIKVCQIELYDCHRSLVAQAVSTYYFDRWAGK